MPRRRRHNSRSGSSRDRHHYYTHDERNHFHPPALPGDEYREPLIPMSYMGRIIFVREIDIPPRNINYYCYLCCAWSCIVFVTAFAFVIIYIIIMRTFFMDDYEPPVFLRRTDVTEEEKIYNLIDRMIHKQDDEDEY